MGFFDLLDKVDTWVSMDNVQASKRTFIVRNKICTLEEKEVWLTVPLKGASQKDPICRAHLDKDKAWWVDHWNKIRTNYGHAPYFRDLGEWVRDLLVPRTDEELLSSYNTRIIRELAQYLGIDLEIRYASRIREEIEGTAQDKTLYFVEHLGATDFYNFKKGVEVGLYDPVVFREKGISLWKQDYTHPAYEQVFQSFHPYMSVIDLILHKGPESMEIIRKGSNWIRLDR